jgi:hypothetical protein
LELVVQELQLLLLVLTATHQSTEWLWLAVVLVEPMVLTVAVQVVLQLRQVLTQLFPTLAHLRLAME